MLSTTKNFCGITSHFTRLRFVCVNRGRTSIKNMLKKHANGVPQVDILVRRECAANWKRTVSTQGHTQFQKRITEKTMPFASSQFWTTVYTCPKKNIAQRECERDTCLMHDIPTHINLIRDAITMVGAHSCCRRR